VADILVPDLPYIGPPGSLTYAPRGIKLSPGGHSGNVAINLAQLGTSDVHAAGSIGKDMMGGFLVEQLHAAGVTVHSEVHEDTTTAKNVALLVKGEDRRFIAELTANSKLTPKFLKKTITKVKPKVYYQGTLGGLPFIEQMLPELLQHARRLGSFTFLDLIMPSNGWDYLLPSLVETDLLHCNLDEGRSLTGKQTLLEVAENLLEQGVKSIIVTDGGNGLTAGTRDYIVEMPSFKVTQIDPTGAGDALCAGIIQSIIGRNVFEENEFINALIQGQASGAACVTGIGATTNVERNKIEEILQSKGEILEKTRIKRR
jgi:sugar/nucleoside kinase (ribokinase family)